MTITFNEFIAWFIIISFILFVIVGMIAGVIYIANDQRTNNYCEDLGYDYVEIVGDKFNCCSEEKTELVLSNDSTINEYYSKIKKCVAGGVYPVK